ncbi:TolC family outer membrane protein [Kordiimonas sp. SCSIO 12610]|uniref:TolC family outer membrane protein n=1 Tax=Kordiimonas sp. SCSIO 12610 TaxID=2829597 RepID=UPI00210DC76B|nr:TolC family outer membrane protein [Kordiimonas sp. SCSIO 12610]UTW56642.1 TolC family outer membrane protein [Kordiimonas sp. SCSIO 12610]
MKKGIVPMGHKASAGKKSVYKSTVQKGLVSLCAVAAIVGGSYSVSAETLKEALAAAYSSNPQLLAQRAILRGADESVSRAKSGFLPTVDAQASFTRGNRTNQQAGTVGDLVASQGITSQAELDAAIATAIANGQQPPFPEGTLIGDPPPSTRAPTDNDFYQLQATQNLFNGFRDRNLLKQTKRQVLAGRAQLQSVEQQVLLDAVTAYMDVFRDEAVVRLNENQVQVLERQLQASRDRFRVGEITRTDVAQSEARLEGAKSNKLAADATLAASRARYRRVIGRAPATLENPNGKPELPISLDAAIEQAMTDSPGVKAARYTEEAAKYAVKQAKGALLPQVSLRGNVSRNTGTFFLGNLISSTTANTTQATLNINVPLYAGGARHSDIRRAKQEQSQRRIEILQAERVAQEGVFAAWDNYRATKGQITANEAQVKANEIALEGVEQEAAVGSRTTLDVLDAQQELLNSQVNLVRAQRDEFVAAYTLVSATGALTAARLNLDAPLYDPEEHYKDVKNQFIGW